MTGKLIIITGLSGSGKSTAARALEDRSFFVVDNLPLVMLPDFLQRAAEGLAADVDLAVVIDVRNRDFLADQERIFALLKESNYSCQVYFFEAANDVLQRRYSETRRAHPLAFEGSVQAGIERERVRLAPLREAATRVIDTSNLTTQQLRDHVLGLLDGTQSSQLIVNLESFGYRYGVPPAADLVFDVRFLPNPYYIDELRPLSGLDAHLRHYVVAQPACREFRTRLDPLLDFLLPAYRAEGKSYLTIAIGCTGGRHRSVSIVEDLKPRLAGLDVVLRVNHRDIDKGC